MATRAFLHAKIRKLAARLRRLGRIDAQSLGLRDQDMPYAPSQAHFDAANNRLGAIGQAIRRRFEQLERNWTQAPHARLLVDMALVEREIDRSRRAFGMFFEVFAQRGTSFAPSLAAHDAIAQDCYDAVRRAAPAIFDGPLLKPVSYMEHGYSPATMRRGVQLSRLLGEPNPFPVIRIPWDRDQPWQPVFLHEVAHNLQADLRIWQENRSAVVSRVLRSTRSPLLGSVYGRWHKEIFADLAAILLGGPAAAWGMAEFLAHPAPRALTYRPGSAHPTAYLRILILAEMLRRLGFSRDASRLTAAWGGLYDPRRFHRMPVPLVASADGLIPHVVDEIAFQTRRNLAQRALIDVMPFRREDQQTILAGARRLAEGRTDAVTLPPRFMVSAASYAVTSGRIAPEPLGRAVVARLAEERAAAAPRRELRLAA